MVPAAFVVLGELPLTPNGKVNRQALPAPESFAADLTSAAPLTPEEQTMAALWSDILGRPNIGRDDRFFDIGGHSLLAMQMLARLEKATGIEVPLRVLFEASTLAELTAHVSRAVALSLERDNLDELLSQLEQLTEEEAERLV